MAASMDEHAVSSASSEYFNAMWCCRFRECPCTSNTIYNNSTISLAPEDAKYQATVFFQDFRLGVGPNTNISMITYTEEDINALKTIYESYTTEYSPLSLASSSNDDIITRFYFQTLSLRVNNDNDNDLPDTDNNSNALGTLEYILLFESRTDDVSNYHELFRQWTVDHSEKVLEDWQQALEGWNITELDDPVWASSMEGPRGPPPMVVNGAEYDTKYDTTTGSVNYLPAAAFVGLMVALVAIVAKSKPCHKRRDRDSFPVLDHQPPAYGGGGDYGGGGGDYGGGGGGDCGGGGGGGDC